MCRALRWVIAGHGPAAMPPSIAFLTGRRAPDAVRPVGTLRIILIAAMHAAALALMLWSEIGLVPTAGAVAAALHDLDGAWRTRLPMRREREVAPA